VGGECVVGISSVGISWGSKDGEKVDEKWQKE
jgi:hypothetical protein